jgi:hypothetical protein
MLVSPLVAEAKVMVVAPLTRDAMLEVPANNTRMARLLTNVLDLAGTDYVVVPARSAKTEFCRSGVMVWNYGTAGAYTETFDGVIHLGFLSSANYSGASADAPNYRPESLFKASAAGEGIGTGTTKAPSVPQLVLSTNAQALVASDNALLFVDATTSNRCTTGTNSGGVGGLGRAGYLAGDPTVRWINDTYTEAVVRNSTAPAGGWRALVGASIPNLEAREPSNRDDHICRWCDSMVTSSAGALVDTVFAFERLMTHVTGSSPVVFVQMAGAGLSSDSLFDAGATPGRPVAEGNIAMMMLGLARLDSLTGGAVFPKDRPPIRVAVTVDGAYSYRDSLHHYGITKRDSSTFDASMDSLAELGIPVTFGVNIDSVVANAEWKRWLAKVPKARFSPQSWTGVSDTTANSGAASWTNHVDMMGRYRRRAAFGDSSAAGADTTLWANLRSGRFKCDSIWKGKASRFLMAPDDDWSPLGMNGRGAAPGLDSIAFAIARAGFDGIRVNSGDPDHDANYLPANPKGWVNRQGWLSGHRGSQVKLLAYPGHGLGGSANHYAHSDSAVPIDSGYVGMIFQDLNRAWVGMTQKQDWNNDTWPYDGNLVPRSHNGTWLNEKDMVWREKYRGSVVRLGCNDFSGASGHPARRGWWLVKSLANQFKAINRLAGRTIIEFAYPEDIDP